MSSLMDEDGYIYDVDEFTENDLELIVMTKEDELSMNELKSHESDFSPWELWRI